MAIKPRVLGPGLITGVRAGQGDFPECEVILGLGQPAGEGQAGRAGIGLHHLLTSEEEYPAQEPRTEYSQEQKCFKVHFKCFSLL